LLHAGHGPAQRVVQRPHLVLEQLAALALGGAEQEHQGGRPEQRFPQGQRGGRLALAGLAATQQQHPGGTAAREPRLARDPGPPPPHAGPPRGPPCAAPGAGPPGAGPPGGPPPGGAPAVPPAPPPLPSAPPISVSTRRRRSSICRVNSSPYSPCSSARSRRTA